MKKVYWIVQIKNKSVPHDEVIIKEVSTLGDHPEIARDKVLNALNFDNSKVSYYSEDILSIQKLKEEEVGITNGAYD